MPDPITIKGIREGLLVTVSDGETWPATAQGLLTHIDQATDFFKGARVALAIGPRALSAADLGRLRDDLSDRSVSLWAVLSDSTATVKAAQALGLNVALPTSAPARREQPEAAVDPEVARQEAVYVRRTLRSGQSVSHPGHVIVVGDVNAGAEIVAEGDIIVWGRLRGTVHAGASGDAEAIVCALDLSPTQLRIANSIAISPPRKGEPRPELARIKDGHITAERWSYKGK
ncbi:MAG: septum site-determining protein MinC [Anaerolineales bacterium]|nr:septum site-determining protein MinC [Anaerolineales bacterium]